MVWTYNVTNTGNVNLTDVIVDDDKIGYICTFALLEPNEMFTCTNSSNAQEGQYMNNATATGTPLVGDDVTDEDPSHYFGESVCAPGTGTPGYWKNHPDAWPVDEITIGGVTYTKAEAIEEMSQPEKNDKTYTMFRALVSAKLNVMIGNDDSCIEDNISAADAWMTINGPVGNGVKAGGKDSAWREGDMIYQRLDLYNNGGLSCAASRDTSDLSITKTAQFFEVAPSATFNYTILVQNLGAANATGVNVTDMLDDNLTFNSSSDCDHDGQLVYCYIGDLSACDMKTLTFSVDVNSSINSEIDIENIAKVDGDDTKEWEDGWEFDRRLNNQDNATITVLP